VQNDIKWIKSQIEVINRWIKYHDTHPNSRGHESDMETSTPARAEEEKGVKRYKQPSSEDESGVTETPLDKSEDRTDTSPYNA